MPCSEVEPVNKEPTSPTVAAPSPSVSQRFVQLISDAGVFTEVINGHQQLSYTTGLLLQDIHTHLGVSWEKIPLLLVECSQAMFGPLDECALPFIHRSAETLRAAADRSAAKASEMSTEEFAAEKADGSGI